MDAQHTKRFEFSDSSPQDIQNLCGPNDSHLRSIAEHLGVQLHLRGNQGLLQGTPESIARAEAVLHVLFQEAQTQALTEERIFAALQDSAHPHKTATRSIQCPRMLIKGQTESQRHYLQRLNQYTVNFGIGPAGTGKTFLAVAHAVQALSSGRVERIILTRPAVEAGENLGYLPGTLSEKIDPYLAPLFDALHQLVGAERVEKWQSQGMIEIAPLAFMRGRTLNRAIILLDEAQNTTIGQMKMFLTRFGFGAQVIVTGDISQCDLPRKTPSGLNHALHILSTLPTIGVTHFSAEDVVRHPLVQAIVNAYAEHEAREATCLSYA